jgi:hypothetical protein
VRFPGGVTNSIVFLGARANGEAVRYGGTAFLVGIPASGSVNLHHSYLVTAAHSVRAAGQKGLPLCIRYNTTDGKAIVVEAGTNWLFHDDAAVDLAVLPVALPANHDLMDVPAEAIATDDLLAQQSFGIGDEVFATGLFYFRHGRHRNLPVLRTGIVASMPDEPFIDDASGLPYDAYLVEMRSFGGLSGTPVFTAMSPGSPMGVSGRVFMPLIHRLVLIGIIRGHWDMSVSQLDFSADDVEQANVGLTIVTPAQKLTELLFCDELRRERRQDEAARAGRAGVR